MVPDSLKIGDESLETCLKSIRLAVNKLWDPPLLIHYTRHGLDHSERIIEILGSVLTQNIILSEKERFILQASAYLHDIGMQSPKYAGLPEKEDYSIDDKELIRGKHNKSSAKMINDSVSQNPPFSLGLDSCKEDAHYIAIISEYHRDSDINKLKDKSGGKLRLPLIAALLRFADELDADHRRVNIETLKFRYIPASSKYHWWAHYYIDSVSIENGKIKIWFRFPETYKQNEMVEAFRQKAIDSIKTQLLEVHEILYDYGIKLFHELKTDEEYHPSGLELVPEDLQEYIKDIVLNTRNRSAEASRRTGLQWYVDGVTYSDDNRVAECLKDIFKLINIESYPEAVKQIEQCRSLFMNPKDKMIFLGVAGNCYQTIGNLAIAESHYKDLLLISERTDIQKVYPEVNVSAKAATLNNLGLIYFTKGDWKLSRDYYDKALDIYENAKNEGGVVSILCNIGNIYRCIGEIDKAIDYFNKSLDIINNLGNRLMRAAVLSNLAIIYFEKGNVEIAHKHQEEALDIFKERGNKEGESQVLGNIAHIFHDNGDLQKALECLEKALDLVKIIGNKQLEATHFLNIGNIYADKGEFSKSLECRKNALKLFREIGCKHGEAGAIGNIALVCRDTGKLDQALKYHNEARDIFKQINYKQREYEQLINISSILADEGKLNEAIANLTCSLRIFRNMKYKQDEAFALSNIAEICSKKNNYGNALKYLNRALDIFKEIKFVEGEAQSLCSIGLVYYNTEDLDKAFDYLNQGLDLFNKIGTKKKIAIQLGHLGLVFKKLGKNDEALSYFKEALKIEEKIGYRMGEAKQLNNIGDLYISERRYDLAIEIFNDALRTINNMDCEFRNIVIHNIIYAICKINILALLNSSKINVS